MTGQSETATQVAPELASLRMLPFAQVQPGMQEIAQGLNPSRFKQSGTQALRLAEVILDVLNSSKSIKG